MDEFILLLEEQLGESKPAGDNTRFCCPFCGEMNYKFYVRNDTGVYQCFHCGRKGNPVSFLENYFHYNYKEAKEQVEDWSSTLLDKETIYKYEGLTESESLYLALIKASKGEAHEKITSPLEKTKRVPLPTNFKLLVDNMYNPEAFPYFIYLNNRGITLEQIKFYNIGYVTNGMVRKSSLSESGEIEYFTIRNSIIFTTYDDEGKYLYWNSRAIDGNKTKSINAPSMKDERSKNDVIFNLNNAKHTDRIILCEGVFNAITVGQSGVATFGKQITDDQLEALKVASLENPSLKFYVFLDNDAKKQAAMVAKKLSAFSDKVYLVFNPFGDKDANDLGEEVSTTLINHALPYNDTNELKFFLLDTI